MKVDFNIIKDTSNKTKVIIFGIITVLVSLIGLTYSWVANWLVGSSSDMSLTSAMLHLNYRGTSPTILAYLAPGETVEKNFEITNYNSASATYNLSWVSVQNLFNPTSEIIYTVSERTLGEIVSARTAPSSDVNIARNISIGPGETQYLTLTLTFVLDEERDQTNNIGNYFVGDISMDQNPQIDLNYTEIYANDVLVHSIPDMTTFKFDDKRSWCTDGTTISFNTENSTFSYTNLISTTSCKTYFYTSKDFAYIDPTVSAPSPYHTYDVPYTGWYEIETWGAQGGSLDIYNNTNNGGRGAYTSGKIYLTANESLYIYVGGQGQDITSPGSLVGLTNTSSSAVIPGGYNGGGSGIDESDSATLTDNETGTSGGGATDIRLSTSTNAINSRIMIAAGGSGAYNLNGVAFNGTPAGGLIGVHNNDTTYNSTQLSGNTFGLGINGVYYTHAGDWGSSGGGGGYYGGTNYATPESAAGIYNVSSGGSSFISGHTGCVAIASSDLTNNPRTPRSGTGGVSCETGTTENSCSIHYSNKYFKDTRMIDGAGHLWTYQKGIQEQMPNPNGGYYDLGVGHSGDGYAKIKYVPNLATRTMTFDLAGGIQSKDYDGEYYEGYNYYIENPIRYGHYFVGWTVNGIGTKINNNILTVGVANSALTANWVQAYTLTINAAGGTCGAEIPDYMSPDEELHIPTPTREGYSFLSWAISATDGSGTSTGSTINGTTFTMGIKNTTLTATWFKTDYDYIVPTNENLNPYYTLTIPKTGWYEIEAWGASAPNSTYVGGKGGYTSGKIFLTQGEALYVYVGGTGIATATNGGLVEGGYNGGGSAYGVASSGGGATDIRLSNGTDTLNSRIMVAAGGGGAVYYSDNYASASGGNAGGLIGSNSTLYSGGWADPVTSPTGGTQITGGTAGFVNGTQEYGIWGSFGQGASGRTFSVTSYIPGGGGGYYGGGNGRHVGSGGGSSFISGYAGVMAIDEGSTGEIRAHDNNNTKHYSGKYFIDGIMIPGNKLMISPTGTGEMGHAGNGYARITYLGSNTPLRINTKLNNVRYIKDCSTGNASDGHVRWDEIQAIDTNGLNVAFGKSVIDYTVDEYPNYPYSKITDGIVGLIDMHSATLTNAQGTNRCVTVDLGSTYDLNEIAVWHMASEIYPTFQPYYNNYTQVSSDNTNWTTIRENESVSEDSTGKRVSAYRIQQEFPYTGSVQTFTVQLNGIYQIEAWGASGGSYTNPGGKGGYTSGKIALEQDDILYFYVGGQGIGYAVNTGEHNGPFNSGGGSSYFDTNWGGGTGGGATDITLSASDFTLNNLTYKRTAQSYLDRIMVAGAGGGSLYKVLNQSGGNAGGLSTSSFTGYAGHVVAASSQTSGFEFGIGGRGAQGSGGGSGYYGGWHSPQGGTAGNGGTSFISGHAGCVAFTSSGPGTYKSGCSSGSNSVSCSTHYSDKVFFDTVMIDGSGRNWIAGSTSAGSTINMPSPNGGTEVGHSGNGYARITFLGEQ